MIKAKSVKNRKKYYKQISLNNKKNKKLNRKFKSSSLIRNYITERQKLIFPKIEKKKNNSKTFLEKKKILKNVININKNKIQKSKKVTFFRQKLQKIFHNKDLKQKKLRNCILKKQNNLKKFKIHLKKKSKFSEDFKKKYFNIFFNIQNFEINKVMKKLKNDSVKKNHEFYNEGYFINNIDSSVFCDFLDHDRFNKRFVNKKDEIWDKYQYWKKTKKTKRYF